MSVLAYIDRQVDNNSKLELLDDITKGQMVHVKDTGASWKCVKTKSYDYVAFRAGGSVLNSPFSVSSLTEGNSLVQGDSFEFVFRVNGTIEDITTSVSLFSINAFTHRFILQKSGGATEYQLIDTTSSFQNVKVINDETKEEVLPTALTPSVWYRVVCELNQSVTLTEFALGKQLPANNRIDFAFARAKGESWYFSEGSGDTLTGTLGTVLTYVDTGAIWEIDSVLENSRIQLTGTSGTAQISIDGSNYSITFNTDLATTAADFITSHAANILTNHSIRVKNEGIVNPEYIAFSSSQNNFKEPTISNLTGDLLGIEDLSLNYFRKIVNNSVLNMDIPLNTITPQMLGYKNISDIEYNTEVDAYPFIQACLDSIYNVVIPPGYYYLSKGIIARRPKQITMFGNYITEETKPDDYFKVFGEQKSTTILHTDQNIHVFTIASPGVSVHRGLVDTTQISSHNLAAYRIDLKEKMWGLHLDEIGVLGNRTALGQDPLTVGREDLRSIGTIGILIDSADETIIQGGYLYRSVITGYVENCSKGVSVPEVSIGGTGVSFGLGKFNINQVACKQYYVIKGGANYEMEGLQQEFPVAPYLERNLYANEVHTQDNICNWKTVDRNKSGKGGDGPLYDHTFNQNFIVEGNTLGPEFTAHSNNISFNDSIIRSKNERSTIVSDPFFFELSNNNNRFISQLDNQIMFQGYDSDFSIERYVAPDSDWFSRGVRSGTATVQLTGGASGSIDGITVDGLQIMSGSVPFNTDLSTTAKDVAENIRNFKPDPILNYSATAVGDTITIESEEKGYETDGYVVISSTTIITSTDTNFTLEAHNLRHADDVSNQDDLAAHVGTTITFSDPTTGGLCRGNNEDFTMTAQNYDAFVEVIVPYKNSSDTIRKIWTRLESIGLTSIQVIVINNSDTLIWADLFTNATTGTILNIDGNISDSITDIKEVIFRFIGADVESGDIATNASFTRITDLGIGSRYKRNPPYLALDAQGDFLNPVRAIRGLTDGHFWSDNKSYINATKAEDLTNVNLNNYTPTIYINNQVGAFQGLSFLDTSHTNLGGYEFMLFFTDNTYTGQTDSLATNINHNSQKVLLAGANTTYNAGDWAKFRVMHMSNDGNSRAIIIELANSK